MSTWQLMYESRPCYFIQRYAYMAYKWSQIFVPLPSPLSTVSHRMVRELAWPLSTGGNAVLAAWVVSSHAESSRRTRGRLDGLRGCFTHARSRTLLSSLAMWKSSLDRGLLPLYLARARSAHYTSRLDLNVDTGVAVDNEGASTSGNSEVLGLCAFLRTRSVALVIDSSCAREVNSSYVQRTLVDVPRVGASEPGLWAVNTGLAVEDEEVSTSDDSGVLCLFGSSSACMADLVVDMLELRTHEVNSSCVWRATA
ncbi:uncharacterized protein B0H18DRAFT_950963 [Fomitopsis serialis]|uniref:uncharacterized protein n=1 Tax=Fomitopsis serialis TaxID=139415 RepID=UPI0020076C12|nr:uncharacterized protein B0H18DRAFT_950963 [Neoantrodia serialis]KAH9935409.1 hypothetical protein B0H18DRAFT_950963 [Neoantrodia serialis]